MPKTAALMLVISFCAFHALLLGGCGTGGTGSVSDPNGPVAQAVDTLTTAIFNQEQPAVNAAAASLSPKAQVLVQAAYSALEEAVKDAEGMALKVLVVDPNGAVSTVSDSLTDGLKDVQGTLSKLIHQ